MNIVVENSISSLFDSTVFAVHISILIVVLMMFHWRDEIRLWGWQNANFSLKLFGTSFCVLNQKRISASVVVNKKKLFTGLMWPIHLDWASVKDQSVLGDKRYESSWMAFLIWLATNLTAKISWKSKQSVTNSAAVAVAHTLGNWMRRGKKTECCCYQHQHHALEMIVELVYLR